ncbi:OadG family protein [Aestuariibacter halophilus]|uniref:Probable oxaloacetate decarboxylase gamma chain n=1 Tax=Fluctibacter halophilus TaxID=226011 RepID=A0ABS8GBR7_9ALTE|nr:OadG family transporter subunit [Aestuariibacter halophilus]MCC2616651.1 OadG family protein [Aestuariibacter halophilus]
MQQDIGQLLIEAATLLVAGMTFVFLFLTLLIGAIHVIAWINQRLGAEPTIEHAVAAPAANPTEPSQGVISAISAAVHQYRKQHR